MQITAAVITIISVLLSGIIGLLRFRVYHYHNSHYLSAPPSLRSENT